MRDILVDSMSEDHVRVIEKLDAPRYDEDVADELNIKATIVRTLLNELHDNRLVEYERTKNQKTGWYTYMWRRRDDKVKEHIQNYLKNKLRELEGKLEEAKQGVLFRCGCSRVGLESAMENDFACPDCSQAYSEYDNSETIDEVVTEIARLNSLLEQT